LRVGSGELLSSFTLQASRVKRLKRIHSLFYLAGVAEGGLKLIVAAKEVEGSYGGDDLLRRGRTHAPTLVVTEQTAVRIEVPDLHAHLRGLKELLLHHDGQLLRQGEGWELRGEGVGRYGVCCYGVESGQRWGCLLVLRTEGVRRSGQQQRGDDEKEEGGLFHVFMLFSTVSSRWRAAIKCYYLLS
jgi:hypothetical protein